MQIEVKESCPNDFLNWDEFAQKPPPDPYDAYGWFHLTVGEVGQEAGNDFQVCVATPTAFGRLKALGTIPGIVVDWFDAATVRQAIETKVASTKTNTWHQAVDQLRTYMLWEYEGMAGN